MELHIAVILTGLLILIEFEPIRGQENRLFNTSFLGLDIGSDRGVHSPVVQVVQQILDPHAKNKNKSKERDSKPRMPFSNNPSASKKKPPHVNSSEKRISKFNSTKSVKPKTPKAENDHRKNTTGKPTKSPRKCRNSRRYVIRIYKYEFKTKDGTLKTFTETRKLKLGIRYVVQWYRSKGEIVYTRKKYYEYPMPSRYATSAVTKRRLEAAKGNCDFTEQGSLSEQRFRQKFPKSYSKSVRFGEWKKQYSGVPTNTETRVDRIDTEESIMYFFDIEKIYTYWNETVMEPDTENPPILPEPGEFLKVIEVEEKTYYTYYTRNASTGDKKPGQDNTTISMGENKLNPPQLHGKNDTGNKNGGRSVQKIQRVEHTDSEGIDSDGFSIGREETTTVRQYYSKTILEQHEIVREGAETTTLLPSSGKTDYTVVKQTNILERDNQKTSTDLGNSDTTTEIGFQSTPIHQEPEKLDEAALKKPFLERQKHPDTSHSENRTVIISHQSSRKDITELDDTAQVTPTSSKQQVKVIFSESDKLSTNSDTITGENISTVESETTQVPDITTMTSNGQVTTDFSQTATVQPGKKIKPDGFSLGRDETTTVKPNYKKTVLQKHDIVREEAETTTSLPSDLLPYGQTYYTVVKQTNIMESDTQGTSPDLGNSDTTTERGFRTTPIHPEPEKLDEAALKIIEITKTTFLERLKHPDTNRSKNKTVISHQSGMEETTELDDTAQVTPPSSKQQARVNFFESDKRSTNPSTVTDENVSAVESETTQVPDKTPPKNNRPKLQNDASLLITTTIPTGQVTTDLSPTGTLGPEKQIDSENLSLGRGQTSTVKTTDEKTAVHEYAIVQTSPETTTLLPSDSLHPGKTHYTLVQQTNTAERVIQGTTLDLGESESTTESGFRSTHIPPEPDKLNESEQKIIEITKTTILEGQKYAEPRHSKNKTVITSHPIEMEKNPKIDKTAPVNTSSPKQHTKGVISESYELSTYSYTVTDENKSTVQSETTQDPDTTRVKDRQLKPQNDAPLSLTTSIPKGEITTDLSHKLAVRLEKQNDMESLRNYTGETTTLQANGNKIVLHEYGITRVGAEIVTILPTDLLHSGRTDHTVSKQPTKLEKGHQTTSSDFGNSETTTESSFLTTEPEKVDKPALNIIEITKTTFLERLKPPDTGHFKNKSVIISHQSEIERTTKLHETAQVPTTSSKQQSRVVFSESDELSTYSYTVTDEDVSTVESETTQVPDISTPKDNRSKPQNDATLSTKTQIPNGQATTELSQTVTLRSGRQLDSDTFSLGGGEATTIKANKEKTAVYEHKIFRELPETTTFLPSDLLPYGQTDYTVVKQTNIMESDTQGTSSDLGNSDTTTERGFRTTPIHPEPEKLDEAALKIIEITKTTFLERLKHPDTNRSKNKTVISHQSGMEETTELDDTAQVTPPSSKQQARVNFFESDKRSTNPSTVTDENVSAVESETTQVPDKTPPKNNRSKLQNDASLLITTTTPTSQVTTHLGLMGMVRPEKQIDSESLSLGSRQTTTVKAPDEKTVVHEYEIVLARPETTTLLPSEVLHLGKTHYTLVKQTDAVERENKGTRPDLGKFEATTPSSRQAKHIQPREKKDEPAQKRIETTEVTFLEEKKYSEPEVSGSNTYANNRSYSIPQQSTGKHRNGKIKNYRKKTSSEQTSVDFDMFSTTEDYHDVSADAITKTPPNRVHMHHAKENGIRNSAKYKEEEASTGELEFPNEPESNLGTSHFERTDSETFENSARRHNRPHEYGRQSLGETAQSSRVYGEEIFEEDPRRKNYRYRQYGQRISEETPLRQKNYDSREYGLRWRNGARTGYNTQTRRTPVYPNSPYTTRNSRRDDERADATNRRRFRTFDETYPSSDEYSKGYFNRRVANVNRRKFQTFGETYPSSDEYSKGYFSRQASNVNSRRLQTFGEPYPNSDEYSIGHFKRRTGNVNRRKFQTFSETYPSSDEYSKGYFNGRAGNVNRRKFQTFSETYPSSDEYSKGYFNRRADNVNRRKFQTFSETYPSSDEYSKGYFNRRAGNVNPRRLQTFGETYPNSDEYSIGQFNRRAGNVNRRKFQTFSETYPSSDEYSKGYLNRRAGNVNRRRLQTFDETYPSEDEDSNRYFNGSARNVTRRKFQTDDKYPSGYLSGRAGSVNRGKFQTFEETYPSYDQYSNRYSIRNSASPDNYRQINSNTKDDSDQNIYFTQEDASDRYQDEQNLSRTQGRHHEEKIIDNEKEARVQMVTESYTTKYDGSKTHSRKIGQKVEDNLEYSYEQEPKIERWKNRKFRKTFIRSHIY